MTAGQLPEVHRNTDVRVGGELRRARQERGLTLTHVACESGLTKGYVSQLEHDRVAPSLGSLARICDVLGIRIGEVIEASVRGPVHRGERQQLGSVDGPSAHFLLSPRGERRFQAIESRIPPGCAADAAPAEIGGSLDFVYVVSGALELDVDGSKHMLRAGESLTFPPSRTRTWRNPSNRAFAKVVWMAIGGA
jgi:transcriptional regulator with XRE-family HTH domain